MPVFKKFCKYHISPLKNTCMEDNFDTQKVLRHYEPLIYGSHKSVGFDFMVMDSTM